MPPPIYAQEAKVIWRELMNEIQRPVGGSPDREGSTWPEPFGFARKAEATVKPVGQPRLPHTRRS